MRCASTSELVGLLDSGALKLRQNIGESCQLGVDPRPITVQTCLF